MRVGDNELRYKVQQRFTTGDCKLTSSAVSAIVEAFCALLEWSQTEMALLPVYLPERFTEDKVTSAHTRFPLSASAHFRKAVLARRSPEWRARLTVVANTGGELGNMLTAQSLRDEQAALRPLARLGSITAQILALLQLTR